MLPAPVRLLWVPSGHLCAAEARPCADALGDAERVDAAVDDECGVVAPDTEPVDALAMVSPRASVAPRAPAPTAAPMSGRVILTGILLLFAGPDGPGRACRVPAERPVGQPELALICAAALSQR
jgi:hypothetical protein